MLPARSRVGPPGEPRSEGPRRGSRRLRGRTWVVVGASLAGARAAETLRARGFDGELVLLGEEPEPPYERPPLSKECLWSSGIPEGIYLRPAGWYAEQGIQLRLGERATGLDATQRSLRLASGASLSFDRLLIATGSAPRRLEVPGADLDGVVYLRTVADARELRRRIEASPRVVAVGGGFIGGEVASACRRLGLDVTVLEMADVPLAHALGHEVGSRYAALHREHGSALYTGETVIGFRGARRVEEVVTASGGSYACELAVVGVGVTPVCAWLEGSGVTLENGVRVDELCRTNVPDVFAAGDVASWWHSGLGERLRVEHFDNAQNQGVAAAASMLGGGQPYAPVLFFWSDQYGQTLQLVGHPRGADRVVFRGRPASSSWSAFYLRGGKLAAAFTVGRLQEIAAARRLIRQEMSPTPAELADDSVDLRDLARRANARNPRRSLTGRPADS